MKRLLIALLLAATAPAAHADAIAQGRNKAGGLITLTDVACDAREGTYVAYSTTRGGSNTIFGCWFYNKPNVFVQWTGGDVSTFPAVMFDSVGERATMRSY